LELMLKHQLCLFFFSDRSQAFHHLLVEVSDWSYDAAQLLNSNTLLADCHDLLLFI
jgi:hypothetical protein